MSQLIEEFSEDDYVAVAFPELKKVIVALDEIAEKETRFEAELAGDILSIEFADDDEFVLNSHRAARQLWLAASRTAWHFDYIPSEKRWIAQKTGDELWETLSRALSKKLSTVITLRSPR